MRISINSNIIAGLLIIQLLSVFARADDDKTSSPFQHLTLEFKNTSVDEIIPVDLDNDGRLELVVQQQRKLGIYSLVATGPGQDAWQLLSDFNLPADVCLMDLADMTGDKIQELVTITPSGVSYFPFLSRLGGAGKDKSFNSQAVHILDVQTVLPADNHIFNKFLTDLDNDGDMDMVIPDLRPVGADLTVFRQAPIQSGQVEPARFEAVQKIPVKTDNLIKIEESLFEPLKTATAFPLIDFSDINGDKKPDLIIYRDNFMSLRLQNNEGLFIDEIGPIDFSLGKRSKSEQSNLSYQSGPLIKDINRDGRSDLVVSDESEGLTAVFLNQEPATTANFSFFTSQKPDLIKRVKGWIISQQLTDLNNDGFQDLILIQMHKVGVMGGLRLLLAQEVNWEINVYLARPEAARVKIYPDNPDYSRTLNVPFTASVSASQFDFQTPCLLNFEGDFNNDGLKDLAIKDGSDNKIKIYFGNDAGVFNGDPNLLLPLNVPVDYTPVARHKPYGEPVAADFDGNGKTDLLVLYRDFEERNYLLETFQQK